MRRIAACLGLLLLPLVTLALAGSDPSVDSAPPVRQFTLYVREGWISLPDGSQVYMWGFTADPHGPARVPGPPIVVNEGDEVEITLINDRDPTTSDRLPAGEGHTIHLHGLDTPTEHDGVPETYPAGLAREGQSFTYRFRATHAGTYFYHCHQNNVEHQQMGMFGPLIVRAAGGARTAYTGGPAFDREVVLTLADLDTAGHEQARRAVQEGAEPHSWLRYRPDYFLVNDTLTPYDAGWSSTVGMAAGERVLIRVINAGYVAQLVHAHGAIFTVVATDGRPWPQGPSTDTVWLGPGEKYDLLVSSSTAASLVLHGHVDEPFTGWDGLPLESGPTSLTGEVQRYTLYVREGQRTMPDGATLYVLGFTSNPDGPAAVPGPTLRARAGDVVEVTLVNDRDLTGLGHGLEVTDLLPADPQRPVQMGTSRTYQFRVPVAGTYRYADPTTRAHQQLGLYGALVVAPRGAPDQVYDRGPAFDRQYTMVLSEMDSAAHERARERITAREPLDAQLDTAPNYFLINGLAYPDTEHDAGSAIHASPGDRVLVRVVNAGQLPHAMHLHGYHFATVMRNGKPLAGAPLKDTVLIAPGESFDLWFIADQPGMFPFHDHFETANTNNGVWLGGMHTMVVTGAAHAPAPAAPAPAPEGPVVLLRDNFYAPNQVTVPVGTTVRWEHQGRVEHTVTSLYLYFDSGAVLPGGSFSYTFTAPGPYPYFCRFHITNRGVVIVQ